MAAVGRVNSVREYPSDPGTAASARLPIDALGMRLVLV